MRKTTVAAYAANECGADGLIAQHSTLVRRIAHHLIARLPDSVQVDDLVQAGMIGLLEAAAKYDGSKGATFETYAGIRIRGAMLDEIRKGDWAPRSVHKNARAISDAVRRIESSLGREASSQEVADAMGVSIDAYNTMLNDTKSARLFSYEELTELDDESGIAGTDLVEVSHEEDSFAERLASAIKTLSEREQLVLSLYYDEELNLKEIGAVLSVSESRVSQIMSQATSRLRARVSDWLPHANG